MKKRFLMCLILTLVVVFSSVVFIPALAGESTSVKGDINYDGVLSGEDHNLLYKYVYAKDTLVGVDYDGSKLDYNGDGIVDKNDLTKIRIALWDVNSDGSFGKTDYYLLEQYLSDYDMTKISKFNLAKCDYNDDGTVDMLDLNGFGNLLFDRYSPRY